MALNLLTAPVATTPATFVAPSIAQIAALNIEQGMGRYVVGSNITDGAMIVVAGVVYVSNGTTAISGTSSNYVKITPSGASASAAFVADLTGVTWNAAYKGYYDSSNNLYLFDELTAYVNGVISVMNKRDVGLDGLSIAGTYGIQSISSSSTWTIPAGIYSITQAIGPSDGICCYQIYSGSTWVGGTSSAFNGIIISDGVNHRLINIDDTDGGTIYYRKFM